MKIKLIVKKTLITLPIQVHNGKKFFNSLFFNLKHFPRY